MTRFETIMAVLNLVAIVGIPILAVVIGQYLNVVNLSPKALIFQGYRALFFLKNFCFFF